MKRRGKRVQGGHAEAEARTQKRRSEQKQPVGERLVVPTNWLTISNVIETRPATSPPR
jgi:hypothetical protein